VLHTTVMHCTVHYLTLECGHKLQLEQLETRDEGRWTTSRCPRVWATCNVVDPLQAMEVYDADVILYFLLREGALKDDGDFSTSLLEERVNSIWPTRSATS
jgi:hypothetical protein